MVWWEVQRALCAPPTRVVAFEPRVDAKSSNTEYMLNHMLRDGLHVISAPGRAWGKDVEEWVRDVTELGGKKEIREE